MAQKNIFGKLRNHEPVTAYTLENQLGMKAVILNYGGILKELWVPDRSGNLENVVLSYDTLQDYVENPAYLGAIIGRTAGRLGKGQLQLDEQLYLLPQNNGTNNLHGGPAGFHCKLMEGRFESDSLASNLILSFRSLDMEGGYPGNLKVEIRYCLMNRSNRLTVTMTAKTDKRTYLNLTNHSYFNLTGKSGQTVRDHQLELRADRYAPVNEIMIPDCGWRPVDGSAFEFRQAKSLGIALDSHEDQIVKNRGIDHPFSLEQDATNAEAIAAILWDPVSGRRMYVSTNQPHMVIYTGNFLDTAEVTSQTTWQRHQGICFEAQEIPNAPNAPWYKCTFLEPGNVYAHELSYTFE